MRAWTIVLFILGLHILLAMLSAANITNAGLNLSIDTSSKGSIIVLPPGYTNITIPSGDPRFIPVNGTNTSDIKGSTLIKSTSFFGKLIESIAGAAIIFLTFMSTFSSIIFTIHGLGAPFFGEFNSWLLEGLVDTIFGVSLFQIISGRSFKTME